MSARRQPVEYRPLNVRDALSYLDQVKVQFAEQPDVYNRFLDVMKEFKGQIIDTPGVIDRVSTLFRGHPALIQGFNTFLPPGYRIECFMEGDGGMITVTTPSGTVSQMPGGFSAAIDKRDRESRDAERARERSPARHAASTSTTQNQSLPPLHSHLASGPPPFQSGQGRSTSSQNATSRTAQAAPAQVSIPPQQPSVPPGPSTPTAAQVLAGGNQLAPGVRISDRLPAVEFNHAISFVNKIKNRFNSKPDTYKQFLEILQTYQKDNKEILEVYEQVTTLFQDAPDLLTEFKQFLPENGGGAFGGFGTFMQAATDAPLAPAVPTKRASKETSTAKKKRATQAEVKAKKAKTAHKADSPSGEDGEVVSIAGAPQTLASAEEVAFFDKVKKFIDDKVTYHEFLKLINLFVQDMLDTKTLVERAELFIGASGEVWSTFKRLVGADEAGVSPPNPSSAQGGYGFGGMINVDSQIAENIPMLDRVKPDLSGPKVKSYGPSYRKLPKSEITLSCTGRDAMCWEVLNDEWVSHPIWAAEDAAPFMTHKKNAYEEALHKSEEERHEYDYHIEANLRTIALLEPLNNKIQTMDPEERAHFNLKAGLGGQSKSIYQRIIKKVYGKELGPEIIRALHDNPVVALPIVLERLKAKDEEWKKAQREWNRVWREQDGKNFYKALDHQGVQFKANDKKTIAAKSMIAEAEARRREQTNVRDSLVDASGWRCRPQFDFDFKDMNVLKDSLKLVISYLDRVTSSLSTADKGRIEHQLRDFIPLLFMLDKEEFDADFGDAEENAEDGDGSEDSDGDASMAEDDDTSQAAVKRNKKASDLRMKLLKQAGEKEGRERGSSTMTPGPEENGVEADAGSVEGTPLTENGDRAETPLPVPADPAAVAEAVEKDKAGAEASEQTWVRIDTPEGSRPVSENVSEAEADGQSKLKRKANFFANNNLYVLIRLIQVLYSRLVLCKGIADKLAAEKKQPINPVAIRLGLAEPDTQYSGIENGQNPAQHYYGHTLMIAERLFEGDMDVNTFEESLRVMYANKAYVLFTLDRVVAAIVKQTQTVLGDIKSQELLALLRRDRSSEKTTTRQQIAYRMQAESVLGTDENLYKVEFIPAREAVTVQLLGREDLTVDDAKTAQERWKQYIDSYVLTHPTEGLAHRVDEPFLKRNLGEISESLTPSDFEGREGLQIKISLGSYKMFCVPETEDYFHRKRKGSELAELISKERTLATLAKKRLDKWVEEKFNESSSS